MKLFQLLLALLLWAVQALVDTGELPADWEVRSMASILASNSPESMSVIPQGVEYSAAFEPPVVTTTTTTTTMPFVAPESALCGQWWELAVEVGWPEAWLPILDDIMWHESRCLPHVKSSSNDYGLVQVNWHAHGARLTDKGITREMLYDAEINLREGLWIARFAEEHYRCWSQPWHYSGERC